MRKDLFTGVLVINAQELLPRHFARVLVVVEPKEDGLTQFSVAGPLIRSPPASSSATLNLTVYVAASPPAPFG